MDCRRALSSIVVRYVVPKMYNHFHFAVVYCTTQHGSACRQFGKSSSETNRNKDKAYAAQTVIRSQKPTGSNR